MFIISIVKQISKQMSTGNFFTSSSFIPMQDRCKYRPKSKDNKRKAEKGWGYIRSIE